jgi:hypothetical protein
MNIDPTIGEFRAALSQHIALRAGARIYFDGDPADLVGRIRLSSGTRRAADPDMGYAEGAYIPCRPWRPASTAEIRLLTMEAAPQPYAWRSSTDIAIIRIPDELISPFVEMLEERGLREVADPKNYETIATHSRWEQSLAAMGAYLGTMCDEQLGWIYFRIAERDRFTLTQDEFGRDRRKLAGLHVDSWDGLPLRHRAWSRNRLCINLGRQPRYSLLINLPLMEMFRSIGLRDPEDIYEDFRGLFMGQRFMRHWPAYPVIRLQVNPGEAYILPTDNMVHDASTEGNCWPDITLTYLGVFAPVTQSASIRVG